MQLDVATLRNLDIFEAESKRGDAKSLFHTLNITKTPMGARLLRNRILHPLIQKEAIEERQDEVEAYLSAFARDNQHYFDTLFHHLSSVRDLERLIHRICTQTPTPRDIRFLSNCIHETTGVQKTLFSLKHLSPLIQAHAEALPSLEKLETYIESTIVDEPPLRLTDGDIIKKGVDPELDELKELKSSSEAWLLGYQNTLRETVGIKTLKIGFTRAFGYYIEVSRAYADRMPASFSRRQTLTSGERYTSQELIDFEKKTLTAEAKIQAREALLFQEVVLKVRTFYDDILHASKTLAEIDCATSFAKLAVDRKYIRPQIVDTPILDIKGGRHPVAEIMNSSPFIPNDIQLDGENMSFALITGPNMGGKSTYIRMSALLVIMAQIGSFIPAVSAKIGIVDRVMSRVGASDDLASGQSTFMVEMTETAHILHTKTDRSLILLDEIGRGTSTHDGLSIAWAVTEFLTTPQAGIKTLPRTLFATHYHELTKLEESTPRLKNLTVGISETEGKIRFLYKIINGKADKSYGLHVAQIAGLPESVLKRAEEILSYLEGAPVVQEINEEKVPPISKIQQDLFGPIKPKETQSQSEKALTFIRSLDLIHLSPLDCFMKLIKFREDLFKKK